MNSKAFRLGILASLTLGLAGGGYYIIRKSVVAPIQPEIQVSLEQPGHQPISEPIIEEPIVEAPLTEQIPIEEATKPKPVKQKQPNRKKETKLPPLAFTPQSQHPACSHELGFQSLKQEINAQKLEITGTIPSWLKGSFISVGPAIFQIGSTQAIHWLDGLAMAYLFTIDGQSVTYTNKIIESGYCKECIAKGKLRGSSPEQKKSTWAKLTSAVSSTPRPAYDNANINVACFNNELVALTETPFPICLDTKTLLTTGGFTFTDKIEAQFTSAHPLFDPTTHEWYNVGIQYAHNSNYIIYKMAKESTQRKIVATIPVGYPTYIHSFAMTPHYIIITETPFTVSPYDLLLSDTSFIENFNWKPKNGTNFLVINKQTGKKVGTYKTEPFFTLHHVNAYEQNGDIIVDLIAYKDPQITRAFAYENLCDPRLQLPASHLKRFIINPDNDHVQVNQLSPHNIELPNINPNALMHKYHYLYVTSSEHGFSQSILKLDVNSKHHQKWHERNAYTTEAVFVPRPGATQEDDGIVLSLILDAQNKKSFLLILDAKDLKELARVYTPHAIPFTVHSKFFAK